MKKKSDKVYNAELISNDSRVEVKIYRGSKYSLLLDFVRQNQFQDETLFDSLEINIEGGVYNLDKCIFILDRGENTQSSGSLVFRHNLYDFDSLFFNSQIVDLGSVSNDRELLMLQKKEIKQSFKTYTANLTYDIELFRQFFNRMDKQIAREPDYVRSAATQTLLETEGEKFIQFLKKQQKELEKQIRNFTRTDHVNHGYYFRTQFKHIINQSYILKLTNDKPRGYIGDSEMMKLIYKGGYVGETSFSKVLYKYSIDHDGAQAVRNRRAVISREIKNIAAEKNKEAEKGEMRVMSVACGPFMELEDLYEGSSDLVNYDFVLLDQDEQAILDARDTVRKVEKKLGKRLSVTYLQDSIRTIISDKKLIDKIGSFDFIYSMGLFDYLTATVGSIVMKKLFSLLKPGGVILIGNYHYKNPSRWFMEYWHDWVLYYRDENEMKELLHNLDADEIVIDFEDSKSQMFLTARKKRLAKKVS